VLDTHYLLALRDRLHDELQQKKRWHWAREEFDRIQAESASAEPADADAAFFRVKGARDLNRRELAALRELVGWRDELARRLDRAAFRVAGNDILLELARVRPQTIGELSRVRIVPRVLVERNGREILEAVAVAERVPESDLPKFPRAQRWQRDAEFDQRVERLKRLRDETAARLDLEPGVLGARERLETIARLQPRSTEELTRVPGLRRWQIEAFGDDLLELLQS
jgi:ribonuclease D